MNAQTATQQRQQQTAQAPVNQGNLVPFTVRLPYPRAANDEFSIDASAWKVLVEAIFPSAKSPDAVMMALRYCRARKLDIFKRPVNIVPMWSSAKGEEVETVWPGINEVQTTAARTGQWAGMDPPKWGPDKSVTLKGHRWVNKRKEEATATVSFPEWCEITVYRMVNGVRCPFSEQVYWLETYSRQGGKDSQLPTDMWAKRPRGQLSKCAKAASLRAAFPEEVGSDYTADEMEGKVLDDAAPVTAAPVQPKPTPHDPSTGEVLDPTDSGISGDDDINDDIASPWHADFANDRGGMAWGQFIDYFKQSIADTKSDDDLTALQSAFAMTLKRLSEQNGNGARAYDNLHAEVMARRAFFRGDGREQPNTVLAAG